MTERDRLADALGLACVILLIGLALLGASVLQP